MKSKIQYKIVDGKIYLSDPSHFNPEQIQYEYETDDYKNEIFVFLFNSHDGTIAYGRSHRVGKPFTDLAGKSYARINGVRKFLWKSIPERLVNKLLGKVDMENPAPIKKRVAKPKKEKPNNLRKLLRDKLGGGSICSYANEFYNKQTGKYKVCMHKGDVCHARINGVDVKVELGDVCSQIALELSYKLNKDLDYKPWLKWFLKDSPFSKFIKPANVQSAIRYGVLIDTAKATPEIAAWVAVTTRWLYEHFSRIGIFNTFRKIKGSSNNAAFVAANTIRPKDHGYEIWLNQAAHDSFDSRVSIENLSKVFKEGRVFSDNKVVLSENTSRGYGFISKVYSVDGENFRHAGSDTSLYNILRKLPFVKEVNDKYSKTYYFDKEDLPEVLKFLVTIVG